MKQILQNARIHIKQTPNSTPTAKATIRTRKKNTTVREQIPIYTHIHPHITYYTQCRDENYT